MAVVGGKKLSGSNVIELAYPGHSWVVVLSAALFFFFEFIQMNMFNAIDPSLIHAYKVTATQLGNLSAMYFYGNVSFLLVTGILLDRISTRHALILAMSTCVVFTYLFALSTALWQAEVCRFITGMASTFCMLSAVRLASRWFPPRRVALVIGLVVTIAMAGGMLAQTPLTYLVQAVGWRFSVMINATLGVSFLLVLAACVRDFPLNAGKQHEQELDELHKMGFWHSIGKAIANRQNWFAGVYTNLVSFPVVILGASWGSLYLMHTRDLTHVQTSYVTTMIFLGMIIGSPAVGWFSDFIGLRKLPMILGALLTLGLILLIMYLPGLGLYSLMGLFFLLGFVSSSQVISYPLVVESNSMAITTTAEGLACTLIMSAGLFQLVFGALLDANWSGKLVHGIRIYSAHDFQLAMLMFPVAFVVALVIAFFIKETRCQDQHEVD
jgi:MFS family permease